MEREILFRGKTTPKETREVNNIWVEGDLITSGGKLYIHPQGNRVQVNSELGKIIVMHEVIPETIGQFIGKVDKNNKKIFENDILTFNTWGKKTYILVDLLGYYANTAESEIVGNAIDNPELLGDKNDNDN